MLIPILVTLMTLQLVGLMFLYANYIVWKDEARFLQTRLDFEREVKKKTKRVRKKETKQPTTSKSTERFSRLDM
jgi:hypothetical protein